jgi:hypothetical protein
MHDTRRWKPRYRGTVVGHAINIRSLPLPGVDDPLAARRISLSMASTTPCRVAAAVVVMMNGAARLRAARNVRGSAAVGTVGTAPASGAWSGQVCRAVSRYALPGLVLAQAASHR